MIALPSIAFGGFSGSAGDVTARQVGGRSILSGRSWPTGQATNAQTTHRGQFAQVARSYKTITDSQMEEWARIAQTATGNSVFGQKAKLSGFNVYVRYNVRQVNTGGEISFSAPEQIPDEPIVIVNP